MCVACNTDKARRLRKNPALRQRINRAKNRFTRNNTASILLTLCKRRARDVGVPFDICRADIVIPSVCPVLGIPISVGDGKIHQGSPTLDRIIQELGYVRGNVAVISHRANLLKNNAEPDELKKVIAWLEKMRARTS
jgi:hypothetical protein